MKDPSTLKMNPVSTATMSSSPATSRLSPAIHSTETTSVMNPLLEVIHQEAQHLLELSNLVAVCLQKSATSVVSSTLINGNTVDADAVAPADEDVVRSWVQLEETTTALEDKFQLLQEVVREEQDALYELEENWIEKLQQTHDQLLDLLALAREEGRRHRSVGASSTEGNNDISQCQGGADPPTTDRKATGPTTATTIAHNPTLLSSSALLRSLPAFHPVDKSEFIAIPRALRGRVSLPVVNDALLDLKDLFISQFHHNRHQMKKQQQMQLVPSWHSSPPVPATIGNTTTTSPAAATDSTVALLPAVSEQQIRQSCAFFRHGEATARTVLLILTRLRRFQAQFVTNSSSRNQHNTPQPQKGQVWYTAVGPSASLLV